jgi:hypothetical protein
VDRVLWHLTLVLVSLRRPAAVRSTIFLRSRFVSSLAFFFFFAVLCVCVVSDVVVQVTDVDAIEEVDLSEFARYYQHEPTMRARVPGSSPASVSPYVHTSFSSSCPRLAVSIHARAFHGRFTHWLGS